MYASCVLLVYINKPSEKSRSQCTHNPSIWQHFIQFMVSRACTEGWAPNNPYSTCWPPTAALVCVPRPLNAVTRHCQAAAPSHRQHWRLRCSRTKRNFQFLVSILIFSFFFIFFFSPHFGISRTNNFISILFRKLFFNPSYCLFSK